MGFFNKLRTWWTFKQNSGHPGSRRLYVLEGASFFSRRRGQGSASPAEQVQLLKRLAVFVEKERVRLAIVLEGKSLREVKHGESYKGVAVYFAAGSDKAADLLVSTAKAEARRQAVTVITSSRKIEERTLVSGGEVMRTATFRKALDGAAGGSGGEDKARSSSGRRQRRRGPRSNSGNRSSGGNRPTEKKDAPPVDDDPVNQLLDVVE